MSNWSVAHSKHTARYSCKDFGFVDQYAAPYNLILTGQVFRLSEQ
jgi:hypothetical protein